MNHRDQARTAWVVDDSSQSRTAIRAGLGQLKFLTCEAGSSENFVEMLDSVSRSSSRAPDLIILDLRLPWADERILVENALAGGLGCLELIRQEPTTVDVPVVIYSAFIDDDEIRSALRPFHPAAIVDKLHPERLRIVIENIYPPSPSRLKSAGQRLILSGERKILRVAALVAALATLIAATISVVNVLHGGG